MFKDKDAFELMDKVVSRGKKCGFEIYTLAIAEQAYIMNTSGEIDEMIRKLELHRKKIKCNEISDEYLGKFYIQLGIGYRKKKDFSKAKKYIEMSYGYSDILKYKIRRRNSIGLILKYQGKYTESIRNYKKVFKLTSSKVEHAMAYNNIANVYIKLMEYDKAYMFVKKAIELVDEIRFTNQKFNYYDTLFEIILLTGEGPKKFLEAFADIENVFYSLDCIYEQFNVVMECINKIVRIIIMDDDEKAMKKLMGILTEAIGYYDNLDIKDKVRVIFAESILSFVEARMIKGVL